ncbi:MAG: hypothetical protein JNL52_07175 [Flavobacteriales bacterium]|nr:hypothetical protein [Flavobacteriales bacterium]
MNIDPFAPHEAPTAVQLIAYVEGRLTPAEEHQVELAMEADPFVRETVEGLRMPGAIEAAARMERPRPTGGSIGWMPWAVGGTILAGVVAIYFFQGDAVKTSDPAQIVSTATPQQAELSANELADLPLEEAEIAAAIELPLTQQIGRPEDPPQPSETPVVRDAPVDRLEERGTRIITPTPAPTVSPARPARTSVQLLYLHDLKLVHPKELYARDPVMELGNSGVDASYGDRGQQQTDRNAIRNMTYTSYMDEALGRFARNDNRGCLEELRFLMDQYPDDVNAQFYAGLCCYNLGLYKRARHFLHQAAVHSVDVFHEEAIWYHALTLQRLGELDAATEAFSRIAAGGGFYAERARELGGLK